MGPLRTNEGHSHLVTADHEDCLFTIRHLLGLIIERRKPYKERNAFQ